MVVAYELAWSSGTGRDHCKHDKNELKGKKNSVK